MTWRALSRNSLTRPPLERGDVAVSTQAKFVDVVLDVPAGQLDEPFTYASGPAAPPLGSRVRVPFGRRTVAGWVIRLHGDDCLAGELKTIAHVFDEPALSADAIALARWMRRHYACTLREALATVTPRISHENERFRFTRPPTQKDVHSMELYNRLKEKKFSAIGAARLLRKAKLALSLPDLRRRLARLVRDGELERLHAVAARPKAIPQMIAVLNDRAKARGTVSCRLARVLAEAGGALPLPAARAQANASTAAVRTANKSGVLRLEQAPATFPNAGAPIAPPLVPTAQQREAIERLDSAMRERPVTALLEGITGSGKTFVYSRLIDRVRSRGGQAIVLVPEIALTPQTAARFAAVFGSSVGVLHSGLNATERSKVWSDAGNGTLDVVVGARSAVFAPLPRLALIVVDEEHEASYKQDVAPRYHAAAIAVERMRRAGGSVVLGSATPSLESYYAACSGDIMHVRLTQRATAAQLPPVDIVDMTVQRTPRGRQAIGATLASHLESTLARGEKALLFVNRRGYAGLLLCRACGFAPRCRRCAVSLVVHSADRSIRCHICGDGFQIPASCPKCKSPDLLPFGFGTQRLEEEVKELMPTARVFRMDSDSTAPRGAHERILRHFAEQGDILIGTQMIAKGLDYPTVTLVGVVAADQDLNRPDFRAAERTFALLTQVAGRAGRVRSDSRVVVQTYAPEHYAIMLAARHDYEAFAAKELPIRKELAYPPFGQLAYLIVAALDQASAWSSAQDLAKELRANGGHVEVLGPAPDVLPKARGEFRVRIALKSGSEQSLLDACSAPQKLKVGGNVRCTVVVDPR
jgi:primosomal protein N' (replication factor Y) (superfamily II helicase)